MIRIIQRIFRNTDRTNNARRKEDVSNFNQSDWSIVEHRNVENSVGQSIATQSLKIRIQKKLIGKLSNKYVGRFLLQQNLRRIFTNLHSLVHGFTHDERMADRLNQSILKTLLKLHVLLNNHMFTDDQMRLFNKLNKLFNSFFDKFIEIYETPSLLIINRFFLIQILEKCQNLLHIIIGNRLTRRSHERIDFVIEFLSNKDFIKYVFDSKSPLNHAILEEIVIDIRQSRIDGIHFFP